MVDAKISVLNEAFKVGKEFISEYVWATICLKKQTLEVFYRAKGATICLKKQTLEVFYRAKDQDTAVLIKKI
jgi:DNA-binding protein